VSDIEPHSRSLKFDVIRVLAIIGVVATHSEAITSSTTNYLGGVSWWFANTVHSLISVSVPLFVMLTGALMLSKKSIDFQYVWQKVWKQFMLPLMVWWIFYYWWQTSRTGLAIDFTKFIQRFFYTDIGHLYYLQVVIGLYLAVPFVHRFYSSSSQKRKLFILVAVTLLTLAYKFLSFLVFKTYNSTNMLFIFLPFITYLLWGDFLSTISLKLKQINILLFISIIITCIISVTSYLNTLAFNNGSLLFWTNSGGNFFWDVFSPLVVLLAGVLFVVLLHIENILPKISHSKLVVKAVAIVSGTSFGIYLIHPW
jgi:surface polysaccharide O-acyltransferase-like enzyme